MYKFQISDPQMKKSTGFKKKQLYGVENLRSTENA